MYTWGLIFLMTPQVLGFNTGRSFIHHACLSTLVKYFYSIVCKHVYFTCIDFKVLLFNRVLIPHIKMSIFPYTEPEKSKYVISQIVYIFFYVLKS